VVSAVVLTLFVFIPLAVLAVAARLRCGAPLRWCCLRVRVLSLLASSVGLVLVGLLAYILVLIGSSILGKHIGELGYPVAAAYTAAIAVFSVLIARPIGQDLESNLFLGAFWVISMGLFIRAFAELLPALDPVHATVIAFAAPPLILIAVAKLVERLLSFP